MTLHMGIVPMKVHTLDDLTDLDQLLHDSKPVSEAHLGDMLVAEGRLSREQLKSALALQQEHPGKHLGELLVEMGYCAQEQIIAALADKLGIPYIRLGRLEITPKVLALVPVDIALQFNVLPLAEHNNRLIVAMEDPLDWKALDLLRFHTNRTIEPVITSHDEIGRILNKYYLDHGEDDLLHIADEFEVHALVERAEHSDIQNIAQEASKKPIVRLVNALLVQGIAHRASDINIRPAHDRINIYYRIDGKLQFSRSMHIASLPALVSRIKIMGRMDIAERRLPQDGHARVIREGGTIDLRISVIPTINGESVVIRILDKRADMKSLEQLGLHDREYRLLKQLTGRSYGMLLITGPTGSGKSTTLYALLQEVRKGNPHIITVEDPVEYDMENIEQIQILPATGYTFAEALRHILRHDPDVVMIGEIRDLETAQIANKAALTGHLVFSTLHTNDAASTITRLIDMGVESYLLSSTLLGVVAQRLVRVLCPHCKEMAPIGPEVAKLLQLDPQQPFYAAQGCEACNHSGYHGRIAVCELLEVTPAIAELINNKANSQAIKSLALAQGMMPLTQNALALARAGTTSIEEVLSVRLD
ncbi:MAG TPA: GspE/PulE family protein [Gammaproteobacteria bacterium]